MDKLAQEAFELGFLDKLAGFGIMDLHGIDKKKAGSLLLRAMNTKYRKPSTGQTISAYLRALFPSRRNVMDASRFANRYAKDNITRISSLPKNIKR